MEKKKIFKIDSKGKITGVSHGETKVYAFLGEKEKSIDVIVSKLIVKAPKKFNNNKKYLLCGK